MEASQTDPVAGGAVATPVTPPATVKAIKFNGVKVTLTAELADELVQTGVATASTAVVAGQLVPVLALAQGVCETSDDPPRGNETRARDYGIVQKGWAA